MIFEAVTTILAPVSILVIPGIAFLPRWHQEKPLLLWTLITLISVTVTVLASLSAALFGLPQIYVLGVLVSGTALALILQYQRLRRITAWYTIGAPVVLFTMLLFLFSLPYLFAHDGLPTGDIQKSLIWAQDILQTNTLPDYQRAIADYNRDPVDFYTPGLHTLLAYILAINPSPTTAGFFGITIALAVAGLGAALAQQLFPRVPTWPVALVTLLLLLTNVRFLRYLREPGYHVQNSVGEFFLFGIILIGIMLLQRWNWGGALLLSTSLLALAFVHQFSMFVAAFALLPFAGALAWTYIRSRRSAAALIPASGAVAAIIVLGFILGLHHKIPHVFSATPHLTDFAPTILEYFSLLGPVWFAVGFGGLLLLGRGGIVFTISTIILLALSQAPRFFIDIPPVRALFYTVVPLSITGAYLVTQVARLWYTNPVTRPMSMLLIFVVAFASYSSAATAFTLSHTIRTNSTLAPEQLALVDSLQRDPSPGGILIDDYNRRSASWLILSRRPMFTRIAADLGIQMAESKQSPLRNQLYLNQLDYEKIFSLGSHPAVAEVMAKHNIRFVTGINESSNDAFAQNPALTPARSGGDIQLYTLKSPLPADMAGVTNWLSRPTTLVNDIGDREDTFEHLPASIRAARLSDPLVAKETTYRTTTATYIPLQFNVGDYVSVLWDQDGSNTADSTLELFIDFAEQPNDPLAIRTSQGTSYPIPTDGSRIRLPAAELTPDERGFITLMLENTSGQLVSLDMIALGLAEAP